MSNGEQINLLRRKKNKLMKKLTQLQLLEKNLEICRKHAAVLDEEEEEEQKEGEKKTEKGRKEGEKEGIKEGEKEGIDEGEGEKEGIYEKEEIKSLLGRRRIPLQQRFPQEKELQQMKREWEAEAVSVEEKLKKVEPRVEKYKLAFVFVHRGDARSGHYWGYGKKGELWFKYDISCKSINRAEIITDIQKCGGVPYSLLYSRTEANQQEITNIVYDQVLVRTFQLENKRLKEEYLRIATKGILQKIGNQFKKQINIVNSTYDNIIKNNKQQLKVQLPIVNSYSFFLKSRNQHQLYKNSIFDTLKLQHIKNNNLLKCYLQESEKDSIEFTKRLYERAEKKFSLCFSYGSKKLLNEYIISRWGVCWGLQVMALTKEYLVSPANNSLRLLRLLNLQKVFPQQQHNIIVVLNKSIANIILLKLAMDGCGVPPTLSDERVVRRQIELLNEGKIVIETERSKEVQPMDEKSLMTSFISMGMRGQKETKHRSLHEIVNKYNLENPKNIIQILEEPYDIKKLSVCVMNLNYSKELKQFIFNLKDISNLYKINNKEEKALSREEYQLFIEKTKNERKIETKEYKLKINENNIQQQNAGNIQKGSEKNKSKEKDEENSPQEEQLGEDNKCEQKKKQEESLI